MEKLHENLRKLGIECTVTSHADHLVWLPAADVDRVGEAALEQLGLKPDPNDEFNTPRHQQEGRPFLAFLF